MNAKRFVEAAQNAQTSIRLAELLHLSDARVKQLEASVREIGQEVAFVGCEGADEAVCIETMRAKEDWCPYCRIGAIVRDSQSDAAGDANG